MNIKWSNYYSFVALFFVFAFGIEAHAQGPIIRSGATISVEADQILEGDFYGFGQTITLSGSALHDAYMLGGTVTTNAPVKEDLVIMGGTVQVHGNVSDDVRILGGEVVIAEPVANDVVILGGKVHILSTASIGGDLLFFGGDVRIDAPIEGSIYGAGDTIRIDSSVQGDVDVRVGTSLILGDSTNINGNLTYKSVTDLVRAQDAIVNGDITHNPVLVEKSTFGIESIVLNLLMLMFSSLTVFFVLRSRTETLIHSVVNGYGRLGLIGFGILLLVPIFVLILMASIIGLTVGFALFISYVLILAGSSMTVPIVVGAMLQRMAKYGTDISILTVVLGAVGTSLLLLIPFVGPLVVFIIFLMIIGAFASFLHSFFRNV